MKDVRYVFTKKGKVILVNNCDYDNVIEYAWHTAGAGYQATTIIGESGAKYSLYIHQMIQGKQDGMEIDHINGDKLDNRRSNLRFATHQQNSLNRGKHRNSKSDFKNVIYIQRLNKYRARIGVNGKRIHLGCFNNAEDAYAAYAKAALQYFGEYARL